MKITKKKTHFKLTAFLSLFKVKKRKQNFKFTAFLIENYKIIQFKLTALLRYITSNFFDFINLNSIEKMHLSMSEEFNIQNSSSSKDFLLRECNQEDFRDWPDLCRLFGDSSYVKLGEGAYGEVFKCRRISDNKEVVLKVIPVECDFKINSCETKTYSQMLNEVIISKSLSDLQSKNDANENACGDLPKMRSQTPYTNSFAKLYRVHCVEGKYPPHLLDAWISYDDLKSSLNDHPLSFPESTQFVVFECELGGQDLEQFQFNNAVQAWSVLHQVVSGMAVAEKMVFFEHRDLHWGNILVCKQPHQMQVPYLHESCCGVTTKESLCSKSNVRAIIIDFTLSHVVIDNRTYFQNLELDEELFEGDSNEDEQFEVYKKMRQVLGKQWNKNDPKTNVLWIKYLINKLISKTYSRKTSKQHSKFLNKLKHLRKNLIEIEFDSCSQILQQIEKISLK